jgi:hypothetical protein
MSTDVASALDGNGTVKHRHPLLGAGRVMNANEATPRRGAA